jgi:metallo-beta-lactamase class B
MAPTHAVHGKPMTRTRLLLAFFGMALATQASAAQSAPARRDFAAEITAATHAATSTAGSEFPMTVLNLCYMPRSVALDTTDKVHPLLLPGGYTEAPRESWYVEPAKVFDNLYFIGDKTVSAWALTTPDGIILIDTNTPFRTESVVLDGLRKLGLDPKMVKYVLVSHAHSDHIAGAVTLQERYGTRVVMSEPDWNLIARYPKRYTQMSPRRDIVAVDGGTISLGGTTITTWLTPGHTPGTLSYTFPVLDRGKPLTVVYFGGAGFNFPNNTPEIGIPAFQTYIESQRRLAEKAASAGATVLLSNHSWNDNAINKIRMIAGRGSGPSPFEIGPEWIQRYFQITAGCARAAQLRLEQRQGEGLRP